MMINLKRSIAAFINRLRFLLDTRRERAAYSRLFDERAVRTHPPPSRMDTREDKEG
jgi:hypothetical protein